MNRGKSKHYEFARPELYETGIDRSLDGGGENGNYGNEGDHGSTWADLDNDGLLDLVIEASAYPNSHAWIYHQLPGHTFENVTVDSGVAATLVNTNGMTVDTVALVHADGMLYFRYRVPGWLGLTANVPVRPVSDTELVIEGTGWLLGETVQVVQHDGKELLRYSGYELRLQARP